MTRIIDHIKPLADGTLTIGEAADQLNMTYRAFYLQVYMYNSSAKKSEQLKFKPHARNSKALWRRAAALNNGKRDVDDIASELGVTRNALVKVLRFQREHGNDLNIPDRGCRLRRSKTVDYILKGVDTRVRRWLDKQVTTETNHIQLIRAILLDAFLDEQDKKSAGNG